MTRRGLPATPPPRRSAAAALVAGQDRSRSDRRAPSGRRARARLSVDLDADLVDELKDAVVYAQHRGQPELTQVALVETGLRQALEDLAADLGVEDFPSRGDNTPKPGRRPAS